MTICITPGCGQEFERGPFPFSPRTCPACVERAARRAGALDPAPPGDGKRLLHQRQTLAMLAARIPTPTTNAALPNRAAYVAAQAWMWREPREPVLLIVGPSGQGKTRVTVEICAEHVKETPGRAIHWWGGCELRTKVFEAATNHDQAEQSIAGMRATLCRAGWLVIDDLLQGVDASESFGEFLHSVLDERINKRLPTVISMQAPRTLTDRDAIIDWLWHRFKTDSTGEAVARRMHENAHIIAA